MKIQALLYAILIGVAACGLTSYATWKLTDNYVTAKYELIIKDGSEKAALELASMTKAKNDVETKLNGVKDDIDKEYQSKIRTLDGTVAKLLADNVRLRDPGHQNSKNPSPGDSTVAAGTSGTDSGDGALSKEATGFLLNFARDADATLEQLRACKNWVNETKQELDTWSRTHFTNAEEQKSP